MLLMLCFLIVNFILTGDILFFYNQNQRGKEHFY